MHDPTRQSGRVTTSQSPRGSWLRLLAVLTLTLGLVGAVATSVATDVSATQPSSQPAIDRVTLSGTITAVTRDVVTRALDQAESDHATLLIVLRSAGGNASAADAIVQAITESRVPVVVWVPDGGRVQGAAVRILMSAHIATMAPSAEIRDTSQFGDAAPDSASDRDVISTLTSLANAHGRSTDWIAGSTGSDFRLTGDQALAAKAIDLVAQDQDSLIAALDGRSVTVNGTHVTLSTANATISSVSPSAWERFRAFITSPSVAYVLLCFGVLGIFLELASPGGFIAGTIGAACLVVGIYAFSQLPVNTTGLGLMILAFVLLGVDLFVSSFGILTLAGLASFIVGSFMVIDTDIVGYDPVARPVIWTAAVLVIALALLVGWSALGSFRKTPQTGAGAMIGEVGTVREALQPTGMIFLRGELWQAKRGQEVAETIPAGQQVEVTAVDGLLLTVVPASAEAIAAYEMRTRPADARRVLPISGGVNDLPRPERPNI